MRVLRSDVLAIVRRTLQKAHRRRSDDTGWTLEWRLHDDEVEALAQTIADEIVQGDQS